jgi:CxxC motif-containing protein
VVSTEEISRKLFPDCLELLYHTVVSAPVKAGDVIISDIMGTGVDIIAAKSMKERE